MFEAHKAKKAAKQYQAAVAAWQGQHDGYAELLRLVQTYNGEATGELVLHAGEAVFAKVTGASLVEDRVTGGHWHGGSQGVSIPIGSIGGRSVRYRVGSTRGHYVQGTPTPTAVDDGTVFVTNQRVVFTGSRQTRECAFGKLIGVQHDDKAGASVFWVSNCQKPTTIHYGPKIAAWFDFRVDLALAHYRGTVNELVAQVQSDLSAVDAAKPTPPAP